MTEDAVRRLVYATCLRLDAEDGPGYLALCGTEFHYRITTMSPELRREMVWLDLGRADFENLMAMVPEHVRMPGRFLRHATVYDIAPGPRPGTVTVVTALTVHYTDPDGETRLFAVGRYHDVIAEEAGGPRLAEREVRLETRALEPGSHLPM